MKKRNVNTKLRLSKKTISNFTSVQVKGGTVSFADCGPLDTRVSICAIGAGPTNCLSIGPFGRICRG